MKSIDNKLNETNLELERAGYSPDFLEGRKIDREETRIELVRALYSSGMAISDIVMHTKLSKTQVLAYLAA